MFMMSKLKRFAVNQGYKILPESILRKIPIKKVNIEVTNMCNIRCRVCPIPTMNRKRGLMSLDNFKLIVNKLPLSVKRIDMNWSGEPLLNKDIFKMVRYAKNKGIVTHISTNAMLLDKFFVKEITDSGLYSIAVCLDGTTKKVHEDYRVGSDFDHIVKNIKWLTKLKKSHNMDVKIVLQTLLTKNNSDFKKIEEFGRELGVDEIDLRYFSLGSEDKIDRKEAIDTFIPSLDKSMYDVVDGNAKVKYTTGYCRAFFSPVILFNGDLVLCCMDYEGKTKYANLIKEDFAEVLNKIPVKKIFFRLFGICKNCEITDEINDLSIKL